MRIAAHRREDDFEINVISLIDVLLTLLMFFVLTTSFVQNAGLKVSLPQASTSEQVQPPDTLTVLIDRDGHYYVDGEEVLNPGAETLKEVLARVAGSDRARPVTLRADAMTPHQYVVTAMDVLGELGFARLSIATTPTQPAEAR